MSDDSKVAFVPASSYQSQPPEEAIVSPIVESPNRYTPPPIATQPATFQAPSNIDPPPPTRLPPVSQFPPPDQSSTPRPYADLTVSEAALYFFLGLVLNFLGLFLTVFMKRGVIPAFIGFAFSFALYDLILLTATQRFYFLFLVSIALLICIYYRYQGEISSQNIPAGSVADFVFHFTLAFFFNVIGLFFGMFQRRSRGKWGAIFGFIISFVSISIAVLVVYAVNQDMAGRLALLIACPIYIVISIVTFILGILKYRATTSSYESYGTHNDFPFWLFVSMMFGPYGILSAILHGKRRAKFAGLFGLFCWLFISGFILFFFVHIAAGIVMWVACLALIGAFSFLFFERSKEPSDDNEGRGDIIKAGIFNPSIQVGPAGYVGV